MKICPGCGKQLVDQAVQCPKCKTLFSYQNSYNKTSNHKKPFLNFSPQMNGGSNFPFKWWHILIIFSIVLVSIVTGIPIIIFAVPIVILAVLFVDSHNKRKQLTQENLVQSQNIYNLNITINNLQQKRTAEHSDEVKKLDAYKDKLLEEISQLEKESIVKTLEFYIPDDMSSEEIKNQLLLLTNEEREFVKNDDAVHVTSELPRKNINNNIKQLLRCFNAEVSAILTSVNVKNIDTLRSKISKAFDTLNNIFATDGLLLSEKMLDYKLKEILLMYNYEFKKEQERIEQKAIRDQMLEEEKVLREIEREKAKIEKEEMQFKNEISKLMQYMQKAHDVEKQLYIDKINALDEKLKLLAKDKENVFNREQNTRAGFVYVISNIGSFGENVFKIGMTRRLEPMERIRELGDASVPFEFDIHAMIFSEDAPALENTLHQAFRDREVNKVNHRKEFFNVSLNEIEETVVKNYNATVTFTKTAKAEQYRQSLLLNN